ncbi:hypothetical protein DFQ26_004888 [Actinomortierella ambigua]|nr:hypothetical protein DFQ26_004888 [Actinomortierella ambigua]
MSIRLVSSAKNLREQFRGQSSSSLVPSGASVYSTNSTASHARTVDTSMRPFNQPASMHQMSRAGSHGPLRRSKSQKKTIMAKVLGDGVDSDAIPDLSMEMTLLIVRRCVKEIRARGLTTKHILRQVQINYSQRLIVGTIRRILDDDAQTELSELNKLDIHLVAHVMKFAIRYSEETLVTYADYQTLYVDQGRDFVRFIHDLPTIHRQILLDLFSLCADVTLLVHLNNMSLVSVAKAISLSIMDETGGEFTTFDASLQQRSMCGAACEDLLRAYLRIKTTYELAKIDNEDDEDENRYVDPHTRQVRSARQRSNENGAMPNFGGGAAGPRMMMPPNPRLDISLPSSAGSNFPGVFSGGATPTGIYPGGNPGGYFDHALSPRSASPYSQRPDSPFSQLNRSNGSSLSRSHSLTKSHGSSSHSRPMSPAGPMGYEDEELEMVEDQNYLNMLRQQQQQNMLRPIQDFRFRRRSSVGDVESVYSMLPADDDISDGYESEPEMPHTSLPDFADGLGWDFKQIAALESSEFLGSVDEERSATGAVHRSNSTSSSNSASARGGPLHDPSPRMIRNMTKQTRVGELQQSEGDVPYHDLSSFSPPQHPSLQRASTARDLGANNRARPGHMMTGVNGGSPNKAGSPSSIASGGPSHRRSPNLRRSISLGPQAINARIKGKQTGELRTEVLSRELALQAEQIPLDTVPPPRSASPPPRHLARAASPSRGSSFSLESSPQDLEVPTIPVRSASRGMGRNMTRTPPTRLNVDGLSPAVPEDGDLISPARLVGSELTPVSNPPSIASPQQPGVQDRSSESTMVENDAAAASSSSSKPTFEVISRPKDIEPVNVQFVPITPISPKAELKSRFQESFPERPISPPPGYQNNKMRSPSSRTTKGNGSPSSSTVSSPRQHKVGATKGNRTNVTINTATTVATNTTNTTTTAANTTARSAIPQHSNTASTVSQASSSSSDKDAKDTFNKESKEKTKAPGFIRALSHKLRSKQSDDQLRVTMSQKLVTPTVPSPAVSIAPPRLELSFLGDIGSEHPAAAGAVSAKSGGSGNGGGGGGALHPLDTTPLSPTSAANNGSLSSAPATITSLKSAQQMLPVPALDEPHAPCASPHPHHQASLAQGGAGAAPPGFQPPSAGGISALDRPRGFTGGRRSSTTLFGSGNISLRELQRRQPRRSGLGGSSSPSLKSASPTTSKGANGKALSSALAQSSTGQSVGGGSVAGRRSSQASDSGSYTTDDSQDDPKEPSDAAAGSSIGEEASGGDKTEPSMTTTPSSSSPASSPKKSEYRISTAALLKDGKLYYQLQWDEFSRIGFSSEFFSEPEQYLSGIQKKSQVVGHDPSMNGMPTTKTMHMTTMPGMTMMNEPSPEQKAAMNKAARQSILALARDPQALAAMKAGAQIGTSLTMKGTSQTGPSSLRINWNGPASSTSSLASSASGTTMTSSANGGSSSGGGGGTPRTVHIVQSNRKRMSRSMMMAGAGSSWNHHQQQRLQDGAPLSRISESAENGPGPARENMSGKSLSTSSATGAASSTSSGSATRSTKKLGHPAAGGSGATSSTSSSGYAPGTRPPSYIAAAAAAAGVAVPVEPIKKKKGGFFSKKSKIKTVVPPTTVNSASTMAAAAATAAAAAAASQPQKRKRRLPAGVSARDVMTKTVEPIDEVFPWMCIEHMAGQESGWVMLEPVEDGAVGWIKIDKLEEEMAKLAVREQ